MTQKVAYIFPGQGIQQVGMGKHLFANWSHLVSDASDICGYSIQDLCINGPAVRLNQTEFSQVAIYIVNALAYLQICEDQAYSPPKACVGHSLGEYNALLAAEVFDFLTGVQLVKKRGELMAKAKNGAMAAIMGLPVEKVQDVIQNHFANTLSIANINTSEQIVVTGLAASIEGSVKLFKDLGASHCIKLNTSGAFHSMYMQAASREFNEYLSKFSFDTPKIQVISNAQNGFYTVENCISNLSEHLINPVNWVRIITLLLQSGVDEFIEIGEKKILTRMVEKIRGDFRVQSVNHIKKAKNKKIKYSEDDIAVVGMACKFPDANNYIEFWQNIASGKLSRQEITWPRFDGDAYYKDALTNDNFSISKWLAAISDVDQFDNQFFNITSADAILLDPQQRLLLQEAWHCIEDSSIDLKILQEQVTSVYIGAMATDYLLRFVNEPNVTISAKTCLSNYACALANRISYHFNFKGMSQALDAACASSVMALHQSVLDLQTNQSEFSLVGGVNILAHPLRYIDFSKSRMLSPDGLCKTFDREANGYIQGEGIGVVLLTKLKTARKMRCQIHGIIKSVAITHSGQARNITVPSSHAQQAAIRKALKTAGFAAQDISYVETHGTGTMLGDPIEVHALKEVFLKNTRACYIGSVKSNIGHLEAASGMAGLIKVLLMLKHQQIPSSINIQHFNPLLHLEDSALKINQQLVDWDVDVKQGRCAGVSAFSFGGVNAHCVVQEYVEGSVSKKVKSKNLPFVLSAKSKKSLNDLVLSWKHFIDTKLYKELTLAEICFNLMSGRQHFQHRIGCIPKSKNELTDFIKQINSEDLTVSIVEKPLMVVFSDFQQHPNLLVYQNIFEKLLKLGLHPQLLAGVGQGYFAALFCSEALSKDKVDNLKSGCEVSLKMPKWPVVVSNSLNIYQAALISYEVMCSIVELAVPSQNYLKECVNIFKEFYLKHKEFTESVDQWFAIADLNNDIVVNSKANDASINFLITLIIKLNLEKILLRHNIKNILTAENFYLDDVIIMLSDAVISEQQLVGIVKKTIDRDVTFEIKLETYKKLMFAKKIINPNEKIISLADVIQANDFVNFKDYTIVHVGADEILSKIDAVINLYDDSDDNVLCCLVKLWQMGFSINWNIFVEELNEKRVSLPLYPFDGQSYWMMAQHQKENQSLLSVSKVSIDSFELDRLVLNGFKLVTKNYGITLHESFADIGIDSIVIYQIYEQLSKVVGQFSVSLFFESQTIKQFIAKLSNVISFSSNSTNYPPISSQDKNIKTIDQSLGETKNKIAIISAAGRFPGANNLEQLWNVLLNGRDCITHVPPERWVKTFEGSISVLGKSIRDPLFGGFITDVDKFDAELFGVAPSDAVFMDPQERLVLEMAWECLELAGYTKDKICNLHAQGKKIGVFIGATYNNYQLILHDALNQKDACPVNSQLYSIANRVSYFFNFKGPSLVVDTACSSSLYALHLACQSIENEECDIALVGGVNLSLHPSKYHMLASYGYLSSDGKCRSFGEGGDGYVPAESVGVVLIRRGDDAVINNDPILAWVCGSGVSHGGRTNGYTIPSPQAQAEAIKQALQKTQWDVETVSYIEAHGTGTSLGDPIEIAGLNQVFLSTSSQPFCAIGSIKSNIGHSEAAAGIAQLAKVLLQFKFKMIAPTLLHSDIPNKLIDFKNSSFYLPMKASHWSKLKIKNVAVPRRAGISSFGAGGVNVHVLLEEADSPGAAKNKLTNQDNLIYVFSARNDAHLRDFVSTVINHLKLHRDDESLTCDNVAYTLCQREAMPFRLGIVAGALDELILKASSWLSGDKDNQVKFNKVFYKPDSEDVDFIDYCLEKGSLSKIINLWTMGFDIPWEKVFKQDVDARIVFLPSRSFIKQRYWPSIEDAPGAKPLLKMELNKSVCDDVKNKLTTEDGIIDYIQVAAAEALGYAENIKIEANVGFFEAGMDSIKAIKMLDKIQSYLELNITETVIFNYQTPEKLGQHIYHLLNNASKSIDQEIENLSLDQLILKLRDVTQTVD